MRLLSDDEVYAVDNVWLGPRGNTLPWRARYGAYAVGFAVFVAIMFVERQTSIPVTPWTAVYNLMATVLVTRTLMRFVDHERPVRTLLATFAHEVTGPRARRRGLRATLTPARVRVVTTRRARRRVADGPSAGGPTQSAPTGRTPTRTPGSGAPSAGVRGTPAPVPAPRSATDTAARPRRVFGRKRAGRVADVDAVHGETPPPPRPPP